MRYNDAVGAIGVGVILIAYFLNTFLLISKDGKLFFSMNILGAAMACYASILIQYIPFVILEAVWCLVSIARACSLYVKNRQQVLKL